MNKFVFFLLWLFALGCTSQTTYFDPSSSEMVQFALQQIEESYKTKHLAEPKIRFLLDTTNLKEQEFRLEKKGAEVLIFGGDESGLMYGGLEASEQLLLFGAITPCKQQPYIKKRGLKMNIPLDARNPSYDDSGDAAQNNIKEVWSWEFWEAYIDKMAINRYNVLSLWNPHPFPSMVKLDKYPEVALDDVCKTNYVPNGYENEMGDPQLVASCVTDDLQVVKKMTIDEKIAFWKKVMRHAKNRGIDIYWITWNICPNSVAQPVEPGYKTFGINMDNEEPGKHGITHQIDNPITIDYHREAVKQFLLTYPDIKGIGVTAGEHMPKNWEGKNREEWLWETYGEGILDAKKVQPEREIPFIHRVWHSDMDQIMRYWGDYPDAFEVSLKYAKARLYSNPAPKFHAHNVNQMRNYGLKSWWNLRNDDIFVFRWANPDYVRSFIYNLPLESTRGFMMGSDGYVWGREFISKQKALAGELEMDKHWLRFMLWGRMAYNPEMSTSVFLEHTKMKYPVNNPEKLYHLWLQSSKIFPLVNTYHWRDWDAQWQIEQCGARPVLGGFRDVFDFMDNPTMLGSDMINPKKFVFGKENEEGKIGPFHIADSLFSLSNICLSELEEIEIAENDWNSLALIDDIKAMAYWGKYFAYKIQSAAYIINFKAENNFEEKEKAVDAIKAAQKSAKLYTRISRKNYRSQMTARAFKIDWDLIDAEVLKEVKRVEEL